MFNGLLKIYRDISGYRISEGEKKSKKKILYYTTRTYQDIGREYHKSSVMLKSKEDYIEYMIGIDSYLYLVIVIRPSISISRSNNRDYIYISL